MNILLFGISNIGKTTTGRLLSEKLGCAFYDLDEEVQKTCKMTIDQFIKTVNQYDRDKIRGSIIGKLLPLEGNKVIAVTPMFYSEWFEKYLNRKDVFAIELQDTPENIFRRLIFTDENGNILEDSMQYREAHREYYLRELEEDSEAYNIACAKIANKFQMNNDPPKTVVERLIKAYFSDYNNSTLN